MNPAPTEPSAALNPYRLAFFWWEVAAEGLQLLWTAQKITSACLERWGQASMSAGFSAFTLPSTASSTRPWAPSNASAFAALPGPSSVLRPSAWRTGEDADAQDQAVPPVPPVVPEPDAPPAHSPTPDPLPPEINDPPPIEVPAPPFREPPVMPTPVAEAAHRMIDEVEDAPPPDEDAGQPLR